MAGPFQEPRIPTNPAQARWLGLYHPDALDGNLHSGAWLSLCSPPPRRRQRRRRTSPRGGGSIGENAAPLALSFPRKRESSSPMPLDVRTSLSTSSLLLDARLRGHDIFLAATRLSARGSRGWRAEKRKSYGSAILADHGGRLAARHMRSSSEVVAHAHLRRFSDARTPLSLGCGTLRCRRANRRNAPLEADQPRRVHFALK